MQAVRAHHWGLLLLGIQLVALVAYLVLVLNNGGSAHNPAPVQTLTFVREWLFCAALIGGLFCTGGIVLLWLGALVVGEETNAKVALSLVLLLALGAWGVCGCVLIFNGFGGCQWEVEKVVRGPDNHTYFLLHAPPPMNGAGHSGIAVRTGGNRFYYTMRVLTRDDHGSARNAALLRAARKDSNVEARRVASMLLHSSKTMKR